MTTRYPDIDGDIWESRPDNRVSLVQVSNPSHSDAIGDPTFTNIPFAVAVAKYGLKQVAGGAR